MKPMMRGLPYLSRDEYFVLNTTGPGLVSRTLAENPELAKTVKVLFPEDVCDEANWNRFGDIGVHFRKVPGGREETIYAGDWRSAGKA